MGGFEMNNTLCWACENAVPNENGNGCSWSECFIPVEGWNAKETVVGDDVPSFYVYDCPEFVRG